MPQIFIVLFSFLLLRDTSASVRTEGALRTVYSGTVFEATLEDGFHFNLKAPSALSLNGKKRRPDKAAKDRLEFTKLDESFKAATAELYICDDRETFCDRVEVAVSANAKSPPPRAQGECPKGNRHGFLQNDWRAAVATAEKQGRLILADFGARWCPGCIRLERDTLRDRRFKKAAAAFVKVKIDVDCFENEALVRKLKIEGIPAVLVLTSKQEEISRFIDYQPLKTVLAFLKDAAADAGTDLAARAAKGDMKAVERLADRLYNSNRFEESLTQFEKLSVRPIQYWDAKIQVTAPAQRPAVLREAISAFPKSLRSVAWRKQLILETSAPGDRDQLSAEAQKCLDGLRADPSLLDLEGGAGEFTGAEQVLIAMEKAFFLSGINAPKEQVTEAFRTAARLGLSLKLDPRHTGQNLRIFILLTKAKMFDDAQKLLATLLTLNPHDPELLSRQVRLFNEQGNFTAAIGTGRLALKLAYGNNALDVVEELAKALVHAKDPSAGELIDTYLARDELKSPRHQQTAETLKALKAQLSGG